MRTAKGSTLVGGRYRPSSTMANLFKALLDKKFHSVGSLKTCAVEKGINMSNRISRFGAHGRATRRWTLERQGDKVRLVPGKNFSAEVPKAASSNGASKHSTKSAKPSSKPHTKKKSGRVDVQDAPAGE